MDLLLSEDSFDEFTISTCNEEPKDYIFKIKSFSLLAENSIEKYDSGEFESGGYKWKLSLYPNGNKNKVVKDYISLYLVMVNTNSQYDVRDLRMKLRIYLLDQKKEKYLTAEGSWGFGRFHESKTEWGFSELISIAKFNDPCNGYLINDTCVFGVDIFVSKMTVKGECLSMFKNSAAFTYTWKVTGFSKITADTSSQVFSAGGHKWKLNFYPGGDATGKKSKSLSIYLVSMDLKSNPSSEAESHPPVLNIHTNYVVRMMQQNAMTHLEYKATRMFNTTSNSWGWGSFMTLEFFKHHINSFLVNDTCIIEADVTVLGSARKFLQN